MSNLEPEDKRWIIEAIRRETNIILTSTSGLINDKLTDTADNMYPGMTSLLQVPVARTWGIVSRPLPGTNQLIGRAGNHAGARVILGYLDQDVPSCPLGGVVIYDAFGDQIVISNGTIKIGSASASNPVAIGDIVKNAISDIFDQLKFILDHFIAGDLATTTTPGNVTAPAAALVTLATAQETQLALQKLKYVTNPITNMVSETLFVER